MIAAMCGLWKRTMNFRIPLLNGEPLAAGFCEFHSNWFDGFVHTMTFRRMDAACCQGKGFGAPGEAFAAVDTGAVGWQQNMCCKGLALLCAVVFHPDRRR